MNVNASVFITKVKNGFFVYPDLEASEDLSEGMVFQDFFAMVKWLNDHFPSDEEGKKSSPIIESNTIQPITFKHGTRIFLEDFSACGYIDLVSTRTHVLNVCKPDMYVCVYEPWSLNTFATSYEGLIESVKEQIRFLWRTYVREEDEKLSPPAIAVKRRLMEDWEELEIET